MVEILENIINKSNAACGSAGHGDFTVDGILYCCKCEAPKQVRISVFDRKRVVGCLCKCQAVEYEKQREAERIQEENRKIAMLKTFGIQDKQIRNWTFENDDNSNPSMTKRAKKYYDNWHRMYSEKLGILFWGGVGTGKTYFAACIANALISDGVPVLMTNFAKIINALSDFKSDNKIDKNEYLNDLNRYKLLIIDDLGAERQSDFAQEIVYSVVDNRYKNGQPLIITTNMTLDEIKAPKNITYNRIYDRLLEMCVPIQFKGDSRRREVFKAKVEMAKAILQ